MHLAEVCLPCVSPRGYGKQEFVMVNVDFSLFVQIANFVLLIFILNVVLYRPIRSILMERKRKILELEDSIKQLGHDRAQKEQTFQTKIAEARIKGVQKKEGLKKAGQEEEKKLINEINRRAQADLEAVRSQVAEETKIARRELESRTKIFSAAIAEKILGRAVS
ncbi:MAG: ATPase [Deltaproteobacteria bacterium]|nr:MAG: ATPase [Deltaproteobacteria bacterium]